MLVRQTAAGKRFSGMVVLELLDPAPHDTAPVWSLAQEELLRAGHVWVGITMKPAAIAALQTFDAGRYGKLSFAYPQMAECRPGNTGNALLFDAVAQAGALLRSGSRENPLVSIEPRRIVAAGFGEAASALITFINARHAALRLGDGAPIFDAYLQIDGGLADFPIDPCGAPLAEDDARRRIGPRDSAVFSVMSQAAVARTVRLRREDSDDPKDPYRLFEVAGAAHLPLGGSSMPGLRDLGVLGVSGGLGELCEESPAEFPLGLAVSGVVLQMQQWLLEGRAPARAPLLVADEGRVALDDAGNALGGLRLPQVQVPLAAHAARSTPRRADDPASATRCSLTGTMRRFDSAEMKRLYGTRAEYLRRFNAAVDQAVADRFIVAADAAALKAAQPRLAPMF
jgi:hypothetical protein